MDDTAAGAALPGGNDAKPAVGDAAVDAPACGVEEEKKDEGGEDAAAAAAQVATADVPVETGAPGSPPAAATPSADAPSASPMSDGLSDSDCIVAANTDTAPLGESVAAAASTLLTPPEPQAGPGASQGEAGSSSAAAGEAWQCVVDSSTDPPCKYYYNSATHETQWEAPPGFCDPAADSAAAAAAGAGAGASPGLGASNSTVAWGALKDEDVPSEPPPRPSVYAIAAAAVKTRAVIAHRQQREVEWIRVEFLHFERSTQEKLRVEIARLEELVAAEQHKGKSDLASMLSSLEGLSKHHEEQKAAEDALAQPEKRLKALWGDYQTDTELLAVRATSLCLWLWFRLCGGVWWWWCVSVCACVFVWLSGGLAFALFFYYFVSDILSPSPSLSLSLSLSPSLSPPYRSPPPPLLTLPPTCVHARPPLLLTEIASKPTPKSAYKPLRCKSSAPKWREQRHN